MNYNSTRDNRCVVTAAEAIARGISADGGLFVPGGFPRLTAAEIGEMATMGYADRAERVLAKYLTDFSPEELRRCVDAAYATGRFRTSDVAHMHELEDGVHVLELWHGPTCAFKDMALQILPHLMSVSAGKTADGKQIVILVATSGDTGKAALEGFRDAPNTKILVFYPEDGVSPMQKLQMTTQEGGNVGVSAIRGNFDMAQTGVKRIFTDPAIGAELAAHGMAFSSANSINWGRLVPQIVYYISAYCDLVAAGKICNGDAINVVVPTGNFGNILAAYYAREMGLPIAKFICASNRNRVLTDFIESGTYDCNRTFYTTSSPSMDILISSNLERLLYELADRDDAEIRRLMDALKTDGKYTVSDTVRERLNACFVGGCCDEEGTAAAIRRAWEEHRYLADPHTAVGLAVYEDYRRATGDTTPTVLASTANPYKFAASVLAALGGEATGDEFDRLEQLHALTGVEIPAPLNGLRGKAVRFAGVCDQDGMKAVVYRMLGMA